MKIVIAHDVFANLSSAENAALTHLFLTIARDPLNHALLTDPTYDPTGDNGLVDAWLVATGSNSDVFRDALLRGLVAAAGPRAQPLADTQYPRRWKLPGALEIRVDRRGASDWNQRLLTITDAEALTREPLHLVLENTRTEPAFLRALAGPTDGATFHDRTHEPAKIYLHGGGGGEVKSWLAALTVGSPDPAKWRRMLRAWVLFDQDAGDPDARTPSLSAVALMEECEKVVATYGPGLSWVCLRRRELESYVPDAGLLAHQTIPLQPFVQQVIAWRADPTQAAWAWALDLKKGLHGDRHPHWAHGLTDAEAKEIDDRVRPPQPQMLKLPFSGLSAADVALLARGLGEALGKALRNTVPPAWASDLLREYDRGPADQAPRLSLVQSLFDRM
jgi:hypothetical protein